MAAPFGDYNWTVVLPSINGVYEAGITLSSDTSLADSLRLVVYTGNILEAGTSQSAIGVVGGLRIRALASAVWALRHPEFSRTQAAHLYVAGAYASVYFGLPGIDGQNHDGDWIAATAPAARPTDDELLRLTAACSEENIRKILTLIIGCKASFWQTNHHTGVAREAATGYVGKVLQTIFGQNTGTFVEMAHTVAHWCSTILILRHAGVRHIRGNVISANDHHANYTLGPDALLRFSSGPAGIHRFIVADAIAKRIVQHTVMKYYTAPEALVALHTQTNDLLLGVF